MRVQSVLVLRANDATDEATTTEPTLADCIVCAAPTISAMQCCWCPMCAQCLLTWAHESNVCPHCNVAIHTRDDRRYLNEGNFDHTPDVPLVFLLTRAMQFVENWMQFRLTQYDTLEWMMQMAEENNEHVPMSDRIVLDVRGESPGTGTRFIFNLTNPPEVYCRVEECTPIPQTTFSSSDDSDDDASEYMSFTSDEESQDDTRRSNFTHTIVNRRHSV